MQTHQTSIAQAPILQAPMRLVSSGRRQSDGLYSLATVVANEITPSSPLLANGLYLKTKQRIIVDTKSVNIESAIAQEAVKVLLSAYHLRAVRELPAMPQRDSAPSAGTDGVFTMILFSSTVDVRRLCTELTSLPDVEYAEPMQTAQPHQASYPTPNDPLFGRQYHWQRIRAQEAWALGGGDSSLVVAVCDTGVDWEHEDLADNIWTNPGESGRDAEGRDKRLNGIDDDRNGKIDDWHGWDFVGAASDTDVLQGIFREDNDPKLRFPGGVAPSELPNHGTHVAGIVAAKINNAKGGTGVALRCKILPLKCGTDGARVDGIYRGYEAILYAAQMGAKVIICSFGGGRYSRFEQDIINAATDLGALVVASAGNDSKVADNAEYPASYTNVLAVGSSNQDDRATPSSDMGLLIDVFAPGENIWSTVSGNEYTDRFSGTSMATPIVAGVAALVRSRRPDWSPRQITQQIRATSDNTLLGAGTPSNRPFGYFGRLNALQALTASQPGLTVQNVSIGAATGIIQDVQPVAVRLSVLNVLAGARNVSIVLRSLDGKAVAFEATQILGSMPSSATQTAYFSIQLDQSALQGTGLRTAEFVVIIQADDGYINYERLSLPYNIRPSLGAQMLVSPLLDFTAIPQNFSQTMIQGFVRNAGSTPLSVSVLTFSGTDARDFAVVGNTSFPLAVNGTSGIAVRFQPQAGAIGVRTATLTLSAQPQKLSLLGAVAGGYEFSSLQAPYSELGDGTPLFVGTNVLDDSQFTVSIGFSFRFGSETHENMTISSNGFIAFAPAESLVQQGSVVTHPLNTYISAKGYIAAIGADLVLQSNSANPSDLRVKTDGIMPNRICTVQWRNATLKTAPDVRLNAQLRLYEASGRVEIIFGACSIPATRGTVSVDVGLRGASSADIHSRRVSSDIGATWATPAEATSGEDACELSSSALPQSGLVYRWSVLTQPRTLPTTPIVRQIALRGFAATVTSVALEAERDGSNELSECRIFPNPAANEAIVEINPLSSNVNSTVQLCVSNALGEIVFNASMDAVVSERQRLILRTDKWAQGLYTVKISTAHQTLYRRLCVLR